MTVHYRHSSHPTWTTALMRGLRRTCPRCGEGKMFAGYLSIKDNCPVCDLAFDPIRADDAPAYFTIFIVGHIVVTGLFAMETYEHPAEWVQMAVWLPTTLILTLGLLPYIKGAVMGAIHASHKGSSDQG